MNWNSQGHANLGGVGAVRAYKDKVPPGMKWCSLCEKVKKLSEFPHIKTRKHGKWINIPTARCTVCKQSLDSQRLKRDRARAKEERLNGNGNLP